MTAYLRPSSRGQPTFAPSFKFPTVMCKPDLATTHHFPPFVAPSGLLKKTGTGQATLTTKIERLTIVRVTKSVIVNIASLDKMFECQVMKSKV